MSIYDKSGVGLEGVELPAAGGLSGMLSSVGGMVSGVAPVLGAVGGLSSMFGGSGSGMDVSKAVSGGTFTTGEFGLGKSDTAVIIIVAVVLGLLIIFKGKK